MKFDKKNLIAVGSMAIVILASNIAVSFPLGEWLTYGAFIYPIAFLITDLLNRIYGVKMAKKVVFFGFAWGILLSIIFADLRVAFASGSAFLSAQLLDIYIFSKLRKQKWWKAPMFSSLIASALDTIIFFSLAFAGTKIPWEKLALGDYLAKLFMAVILLAPFKYFLNIFYNKNK